MVDGGQMRHGNLYKLHFYNMSRAPDFAVRLGWSVGYFVGDSHTVNEYFWLWKYIHTYIIRTNVRTIYNGKLI